MVAINNFRKIQFMQRFYANCADLRQLARRPLGWREAEGVCRKKNHLSTMPAKFYLVKRKSQQDYRS